MVNLNYSITIKASKDTVWKTMLDSKTYKQWAKAFSSDSQYIGSWVQGTSIKFIDPNMGGTKAILEVVEPCDRIAAKHVAIIREDGTEDRESETAKKWIGVTERYQLEETNGTTQLFVEMQVHEDFVSMFAESWPKALELLKTLCEDNTQ